MTPDELYTARRTLGIMWGYGRPLSNTELGRALRLRGERPGDTVKDWTDGKFQISGPVEIAIEAMLSGYRPKGIERKK